MTDLYSAYGVVGDGITDDSPALQDAIDTCSGFLEIPRGIYRITKTLQIPSNFHLVVDKYAVFKLCGDTPKKRGDFLLTNSDHAHGNKNIHIEGGLWDGNNCGKCNVKPPIFTPDGWSGALFDFENVKNLALTDMTVQDSTTYFFRFGRIDGFEIRDIIFTGEHNNPNQDGLHFSGGCRNGLIRNLFAFGMETDDDLLAFNADDCIERVENSDLTRDAIENITVDGVFAENCHTCLRFLSVDNPIRNLHLHNIRCGVRTYAINMDAARYCRTPLFIDAYRPAGVGFIENVHIRNMTVFATADLPQEPLLCIESNCRNFTVDHLTRDTAAEQAPSRPLLRMRNVKAQIVTLAEADTVTSTGQRTATGWFLDDKSNVLSVEGSLYAMQIDTQHK